MNYMKKLGIFLLLLSSQSMYAQQNNYTVSGKIKGLDSDMIYLTIRDTAVKGGFRRDTVKVINEAFSYSGNVKEMTFMNISPGVDRVVKKTGRGYYPVKSSLIQFIAYPGAAIKFSGKITDFVDAYPSGDAANYDLAKLNKIIFPIMNESVNLSLKIANNIVTDTLEIEKLKKTIEELDNKVVKIKETFVSNNLSSPTAVWLLSDMMIRSQLSNERAADLFSKMDKNKLVAIPFYTEVARRVDGFNSTGLGKMVPEINTSNTYNGKRFDLASLRGKFVIIDFWGTWCGPCIAGMPKMKEYLDKYKDKMDILGVAQESDNGDKWRKFLHDKPEFVWHHVLSRNDEDYILKFNVAGFPTKIIIDPAGKIVGRYVGEDDAIYKKLDSLFEK